MRKRVAAAILVFVLGGAAIIASGMTDLYVSGVWRYRLTVAVDTPEGVRQGAAVREIWASASDIGPGLPESTSTTHIKGEAVAVDLGARGVLFALIDWDSYDEVGKTFPYTAARGIPDRIRYFKNLKPGLKADLARAQWPRMVTFADMKDPKSVKAVNPDDLAATFGPGVAIKSVTVEITTDPVTWGIEKWLGWLPALGGGYLDGQFSGGGPELSNILYGGNFSKGEN